MKPTLKYTSLNGYTGVLYGESSMSIYDSDGNESLHTGSRSVETYEELVEAVDGHPAFLGMLFKGKDEWDDDTKEGDGE